MKAKSKQNIFDLTDQYFGDLNNIVAFAVDNGFTLNQSIPTDQDLVINNTNGIGNDNNKEAIEVQGLSFNNDQVGGAFNLSRWFLPSLDELLAMYDELKLYGLGNFGLYQYWTSTESSYGTARQVHFASRANAGVLKGNSYHVRACRSFTAESGAYSLRSIGPGGGLVFDISGTTYMESAPSNQSAGIAWSNITSVLIGTTGTAIGTGQQNTLDIIEQPGHITSAAKLCNDLVL